MGSWAVRLPIPVCLRSLWMPEDPACHQQADLLRRQCGKTLSQVPAGLVYSLLWKKMMVLSEDLLSEVLLRSRQVFNIPVAVPSQISCNQVENRIRATSGPNNRPPLFPAILMVIPLLVSCNKATMPGNRRRNEKRKPLLWRSSLWCSMQSDKCCKARS